MNNISVIRKSNNEITAPRTYGGKELQLIQRTVAKDTTVDEFNMFVEICKRQGLDPFRRQIYALVFNKDNKKRRQVAFITGIDGYRAIAKRSGNYRPDPKEPDIEYSDNAICPYTNPKGIVKAAVTVMQYAIDGWYPIVGTARWEEFAPIRYETKWIDKKPVKVDGGKKWLEKDTWKTMGHIMIAKCAEAQALRKGWPEEVGGLYVSEEMHRAESDMIASDEIEEYEKEERMKLINGRDSVPLILAQSEGLVMVDVGKVYDTVLCLLKEFESSNDVEFWKNQNRIGLQQYWGMCKNDALSLKQEIENIVENLKEKENAKLK